MKPIFVIAIFAHAVLCRAQQSDAIHYTSLNSAIYLGQYEGDQSAADLHQFGDFGVGSEERLASELIMLDGKIYSITSSGQAKILTGQPKIPFASVKFFRSELTVTLKNKRPRTLQEFEQQLDSIIGVNRFAAVKVAAAFVSVKFRVFEEQKKPYTEIRYAKEVFFEHKNFQGVLIGFRTPKAADVLNSPPYHFHVIDQQKTTGGHLIECMITGATIDIDYSNQLVIDLPGPDKFNHINLDRDVEK